MKIEFTASKTTRLDRLVQEKFPYIRRAFLQKLFRKKEIKVAGQANKFDVKIDTGKQIQVFLPDPKKNFSAMTGCQILFEDSDIIAFDKRAGLVTHAGVGTRGNTLREAAEGLLNLKLIVVHRIDAGTSGAIIFAKKSDIARKLEAEFKNRRVKKIYHAVVSRIPKENSGIINFSLKKSGEKMKVVQSGGMSAETKWKVIQKLKNSALLEVEILTGRTHQIRVHLAEIGYPVVGDDVYGSTSLTTSGNKLPSSGRMLLHASRLKILDYDIQAKLPNEFRA